MAVSGNLDLCSVDCRAKVAPAVNFTGSAPPGLLGHGWSEALATTAVGVADMALLVPLE